nr:ABC transporter ATP-binding protein [Corynebacterium sp. TAE3-ERU12]
MHKLMEPISGDLIIARLLAAVGALFGIMPFVAIWKLGGIFLDAAGNKPLDDGAVWTWILILIIAFLAATVVTFFASTVAHKADAKFSNEVRQQMVHRLGEAPLAWFTTNNSGRVRKALMDDLRLIHTLIAHLPVDSTQAIIKPLGLIILSFVIDWRLGLLTISLNIVYLLMMLGMMGDMGTKTLEVDANLSRVSSTMVEFVTGITVVKAFGAVGKAHRRYQEAADVFSRHYRAWAQENLVLSSLSMAIIAVPMVLLVNLGVGGWMVHVGWVEANQVVVTTLIALILPQAIQDLGGNMWAYQLASGAAVRIVETTEIPVLPESDTNTTPNGHDIVFDDVTFSYGNTLAVDQASFTCPQGSVTALVGPSGSGKSTLATLAARFADPDAGEVRIGGVPLPEMTTETLYQQIAFVLQDPQLIRASVRRNITLGKPDATDEEVRAAAAAAQILEDIEALPDGFDTIVGEHANLSGGQQQRIAIARALVMDAPILLLDEATAFTDPESEADIQQALTTLVKGRTVLVIAHRPESIIGADQIVIVDRGRVVATGTHGELKNHPGYARLWKAAEVRGAEQE